MALPAGGSQSQALGNVLSVIQSSAGGAKAEAQSYLVSLQSGTVDTFFIFNMLDAARSFIATMNSLSAIAGLNAYATANVPGYAGTLTADITASINAAQAVINWVITNFPKDSTATWLLAYKLNADGTRTANTFTSAQTAGLQTAVQTFIATIN
jgi:hypothetical protein